MTLEFNTSELSQGQLYHETEVKLIKLLKDLTEELENWSAS